MSKYLDYTGLSTLWDRIKSYISSQKFAGSSFDGGPADMAVGIPYGQVDSTSTSTTYTATVDGITELRDGVCVLLKNGVVTSASGFTININNLGAKPAYSSLAATTAETTAFNVNYTILFIYDSARISGGCWIYYRGYDSNSIGYQIRHNSSTLPAYSKFYRYRLLFTSADGTKLVPANTSTSTNATSSRAVNQTPIDPFGPIFYYSSTTAVNANSNPTASSLWQQYAIVLGYSFNTTGSALTLTYPKPVYIKCAPQSDGSAIIDSTTPYTQVLPSTEDGFIYIYLGLAYTATNIELALEHPVYYYKDGQIRQWSNAYIPTKVSDLTNDTGFTTNTGTITGITMNGSSKGTSGVVDLGTVVTSESDPVFTASAASGITSDNISTWNNKQSALNYYKEDSALSYLNSFTSVGGIDKSQIDSNNDNNNYQAFSGLIKVNQSAVYPLTGSLLYSSGGFNAAVATNNSATLQSGTLFDYTNSFALTPSTGIWQQYNGAITISNALTWYVDGNSENTPNQNTSNINVNTNGNIVMTGQDITFNGSSLKNAIGSLTLSLNPSTYVISLSGTKIDGTTAITTQTIDLPLESVVVSGSYDDSTKSVVLTLQNGNTVTFSVADLVSGLQSEISSSNMLSADLVDDTNTTHKFVTSSEKTTWNNKQAALVSGTNIKTINNTTLLGSGNFSLLPTTGGTMTGNLNMNSDASLQSQCASGSSAKTIWEAYDNSSNSLSYKSGFYNTSNGFQYGYIGTGGYDATNNLRIYPNKVTFGGENKFRVQESGVWGDIYHNYNVCNFRFTGTCRHVVLYTNVPFRNGGVMPVVTLKGFYYSGADTETKITWYMYQDSFYNPRMQNLGAYSPTIHLFTYTDSDEVERVAIGLEGSFYFVGFQADLHFPCVGEAYRPETQWTTAYDNITYTEDTAAEDRLIPTIGTNRCVEVSENKLATTTTGNLALSGGTLSGATNISNNHFSLDGATATIQQSTSKLQFRNLAKTLYGYIAVSTGGSMGLYNPSNQGLAVTFNSCIFPYNNGSLPTQSLGRAANPWNTAYIRNTIYSCVNASTNYALTLPTKAGTIALTSDVPTNYVTTDTTQTISGSKTFSSGFTVDDSGTVSFGDNSEIDLGYDEQVYNENADDFTWINIGSGTNSSTLQDKLDAKQNTISDLSSIGIARGVVDNRTSAVSLYIPNYELKTGSMIVFNNTNDIIAGAKLVINNLAASQHNDTTSTVYDNGGSYYDVYLNGASYNGNPGDNDVTLMFDGTRFHIISICRNIDSTPTSGSNNLITSGAVYTQIDNINTTIGNINTILQIVNTGSSS